MRLELFVPGDEKLVEGGKKQEGAFVVCLEVGQVMVWRGDLVHAGAGYHCKHTRIHAYADPPLRYYARPRGKTNLCRVANLPSE